MNLSSDKHMVSRIEPGHCTILYCAVLYCTVLYCNVVSAGPSLDTDILHQQGHLPLRLRWARGRRKEIRWQKARLVARRGTSTGTEKMNTELSMYSVYSVYTMYSTYLSMYTRSHTARNTSNLQTSW